MATRMVSKARRRGTNIKVIIVAPLIIAAIVISSTFFGLYLGDALGISRALLAAAMATVGLVASIVLVVRFVDMMVKREGLVERAQQK